MFIWGREGVKWTRELVPTLPPPSPYKYPMYVLYVYLLNKYFMYNLKMAIIKRRNL